MQYTLKCRSIRVLLILHYQRWKSSNTVIFLKLIVSNMGKGKQSDIVSKRIKIYVLLQRKIRARQQTVAELVNFPLHAAGVKNRCNAIKNCRKIERLHQNFGLISNLKATKAYSRPRACNLSICFCETKNILNVIPYTLPRLVGIAQYKL